MKFEFNENIILKEFIELALKCQTLPDTTNIKPEWKQKNRYSNIQPCKIRHILKIF
jgi:protein tyrosine phosphatase